MQYDRLVPSPFIFWPCVAGVVFLALGFFAVRKELSRAIGLDKLIELGHVFFAVPLAVFGAEHLAGAQFVMQAVPTWMPGRLFWAYFVGFALVAAALSIILMQHVRWSATLLGIMIFLFVLMIHLPRVVANPKDRFAWAVMLRDLAFAAGAWTLAGFPITLTRLCVAIPLMFFGVEHFLHPEFAPGVPLEKLTPDWVPVRAFFGYFTGAVLLVAGAAILVNKQARAAATWLGMWITLLHFVPLPAHPVVGQRHARYK